MKQKLEEVKDFSVFPTGCGKIRGKMFKKMLTPPFPQKLFTFVKQFILEFEEIPQIRGKLETLTMFFLTSTTHTALCVSLCQLLCVSPSGYSKH